MIILQFLSVKTDTKKKGKTRETK